MRPVYTLRLTNRSQDKDRQCAGARVAAPKIRVREIHVARIAQRPEIQEWHQTRPRAKTPRPPEKSGLYGPVRDTGKPRPAGCGVADQSGVQPKPAGQRNRP